MTTLLKLSITFILLFIAGLVQGQELNGSYSGNLEVQGMQMELIICKVRVE